MKKNNKRDIIIYIFIALTLSLIVYFVSSTGILQQKPQIEKYSISKTKIIITASNWTITYTSHNTSNITVADLLFECADKNNFTIEKEYYTGYDSYFINAIKDFHNGDGNLYWQFYVNGEYANSGCSQCYLTENDVIEWKFEPSSWT
ncbi:MAG: DUF4430 domain-containing protein [Candidatus Thermoplasmatota archaeon]|nr:DUF4430 domain-containing protein [Candidatus Thermoplasmatota archaeon]